MESLKTDEKLSNGTNRISSTYKILFYILLGFNLLQGLFFCFHHPIRHQCQPERIKRDDIRDIESLHNETRQPHHLLKSQDMFADSETLWYLLPRYHALTSMTVGRKLVTFNEDKRFWDDPSAKNSTWNDLEPRKTVGLHFECVLIFE